MPLYDFTCECGHKESDKLLTYSKMKEYVCPKCGKPLKPDVFNVGVKKGHSWYEPGQVDSFEIKATDENGKTRIYDGRKM